jgi:hypothetical protein
MITSRASMNVLHPVSPMQPFGRLRPSPWTANLFKLPAHGWALAAVFAARSDASFGIKANSMI